MSPLNRGPLMGPRIPPAAMRPPMPRFGRVPPPPPPGMARPMPPPPITAMFGIRGRPIPPPPPRPGPMMARPGGPVGPPMFNPRGRPLPPLPPMGLRGPIALRGPMMRPGPRGILPPHVLPHMRPRFPPNHLNGKGKMNAKKANKLEELELKKPWMTDEIRSEIQKKNKLYAKAKKNKDAKEWEEFKDLRNKVTRMIRDAKNEYLAKNPEQAHLFENDDAIEEGNDDLDDFEELCTDSEEEPSNPYCEVCDKDFKSEDLLKKHIREHQTCKIDGCTFTAHPKLIEKHISMQHSTGLYQRMKNLSTEEDIQKWKMERKRRYPTTANIKLKEEAQLEKEERGEVVEKQVDKFRDPFKRENLRRKRKRKRKVFFKSDSDTIESNIYRGLLPFGGTDALDNENKIDDPSKLELEESKVVNECKFEISDDENQVVEQPNTNFTETIKSSEAPSKMLSLVADYESDPDDDEPPIELPSKLLKLDEDEISRLPASMIESVDISLDTKNLQSSVPETTNSATEKEDNVTQFNKSKRINKERSWRNDGKEICKNKSTPNRPRRNNNNNNLGASSGRLTLLKRLLARSVQNERNAIFQCITFIANNNFFDRRSDVL